MRAGESEGAGEAEERDRGLSESSSRRRFCPVILKEVPSLLSVLKPVNTEALIRKNWANSGSDVDKLRHALGSVAKPCSPEGFFGTTMRCMMGY